MNTCSRQTMMPRLANTSLHEKLGLVNFILLPCTTPIKAKTNPPNELHPTVPIHAGTPTIFSSLPLVSNGSKSMIINSGSEVPMAYRV